MVRCAMCDSPAKLTYPVKGYGRLDVCFKHYHVLCNVELSSERLVVCLKRIIMDLNQKLAKVPTDRSLGQIQYNRGMRNAFKLSVEPVEKELERLIKNG